MNADASQTDSKHPLYFVDEALLNPELRPGPRALLLLKVCQLSLLVRPDAARQYWEQLQDSTHALPSREHREAFKALRAVLAPAEDAELGGFAREIVERIQAGASIAESKPAEAAAIYGESEARLRKRWWPFGKRPAWIALVTAWADIDREAALGLLRKTPKGVQKNLLAQMNKQSRLSPDEWDMANENAGVFGDIPAVIEEMLDADDPDLRLSPGLAETVGSQLLAKVNVPGPSDDTSRKVEAERKRTLARYCELVKCASEVSADAGESLMEALFLDTAASARFDEKWPNRFTALRRIINFWADIPALRKAGVQFIMHKSPDHLRDFALSQWCARLPASLESARQTWRRLEGDCADKQSCEAWYLVALVRRGSCAEAMTLANESSRAGDLVPRVRRAWLCEHPGTAASAISAQALGDDLIGQFLLLGSNAERVEFLRKHTNRGKSSLPPEMWTAPAILALMDGYEKYEKEALMRLYKKDESKESQFKEYVRLHGYDHYGYEDVDPYLLAALVAWDDEHPNETARIFERMWRTMKPADHMMTIDVLRNSIFERCRMVFAARPDSLVSLFVDWVKTDAVEQTIRQQRGDMIYTFSLKPVVPFLFCLISAENVAPISARRCDEILTHALGKYIVDEVDSSLIAAAAHLYASDKGLDGLTPPAPLKSRYVRDWQTGVIDASTRQILAALVQTT